MTIDEKTKGAILFKRDKHHEAEVLSAIRKREHPAWSQMACSYRVAA